MPETIAAEIFDKMTAALEFQESQSIICNAIVGIPWRNSNEKRTEGSGFGCNPLKQAIGENEMIECENSTASVRDEIVKYNIAVQEGGKPDARARRGKVKDMSARSRRRFIAAGKAIYEMEGGHCVCLTLTTTLQCPKQAKKQLKKWIDVMRYQHPGICGIWGVEIQLESRYIHYHVGLRMFDGVEIEQLRKECGNLWKCYHPNFVWDAFYCERPRDWKRFIRYLAKDEKHPECYQKSLPPTLPDGLGTNWWGAINVRRIRENLNRAALFPATVTPEKEPPYSFGNAA